MCLTAIRFLNDSIKKPSLKKDKARKKREKSWNHFFFARVNSNANSFEIPQFDMFCCHIHVNSIQLKTIDSTFLRVIIAQCGEHNTMPFSMVFSLLRRHWNYLRNRKMRKRKKVKDNNNNNTNCNFLRWTDTLSIQSKWSGLIVL